MLLNSPMDDARLQAKTGRTGPQWIEYLEKVSGEDINNIAHKEMALLVIDAGIEPWWAQGVTISVEQQIGRRVVGQTCNGTYSASASKTLNGDWLELFDKFVAFMSENYELIPIPAAGEPRTTESEKWRYWKIDLEDGSKVSINCSPKSAKDGTPKGSFGVSHDKLESLEFRDELKSFWQELLGRFAKTVTVTK